MTKIRGVKKRLGLAKEIMKLGHTFETLADEIGCCKQQIGKWCNGDHKMGSKFVDRLLKMGVPIDAILNPTTYKGK